MNSAPEKQSWPELVNIDGNVAADKIKGENPSLSVVLLKSNQPMTKDYRMNRVRVIVDPNTNLVVSPPKCG